MTVTLPQFLTEDEIHKCLEIFNDPHRRTDYVKTICALIIHPNIERINLALGQDNDPMYLAYAVEYVMLSAGRSQ